MASEKILNLIRALKKGTEEKRVHWQDLPDEQMFRTQMAGGLVRVGIIEVDERTGYSLSLIGIGGSIAAEEEFFPVSTGYDLMEDLYRSARMVARGGDYLVDSIIRELNPAGV